MKLSNYRKKHFTFHQFPFGFSYVFHSIPLPPLLLLHNSSRPCCHCQLSLYICMCAYLSIVPPAPLSSVYHKERGGRLIQVIYIV